MGSATVAFHVDMTQQRKGYASEADLNAVREKYIHRARGLPLAVFFNTTIYAGNFTEIPKLVRFFRQNTDVVSLISFQLQADTGRGILRERAPLIDQDSVIEKIQEGASMPLSFDTLAVGHSRCNRYAMAFEINGNLYDFYADPGFAVSLLQGPQHPPGSQPPPEYPCHALFSPGVHEFGRNHSAAWNYVDELRLLRRVSGPSAALDDCHGRRDACGDQPGLLVTATEGSGHNNATGRRAGQQMNPRNLVEPLRRPSGVWRASAR